MEKLEEIGDFLYLFIGLIACVCMNESICAYAATTTLRFYMQKLC